MKQVQDTSILNLTDPSVDKQIGPAEPVPFSSCKLTYSNVVAPFSVSSVGATQRGTASVIRRRQQRKRRREDGEWP